jgi:hypothetical protein
VVGKSWMTGGSWEVVLEVIQEVMRCVLLCIYRYLTSIPQGSLGKSLAGGLRQLPLLS